MTLEAAVVGEVRMRVPDGAQDEFGSFLRYLRRRAGLKQRELAIRVGYSEAHISRLEGGHRRADPATLAALFVPALGLDRDQESATRLLELAERSRRAGGAGPAAYGIPLPAACLVPRPDVMEALWSMLAAERIVAVCGLPGAGKTTVLAAAAREWSARAPVCWLTATTEVASTPRPLLRRLAEVLGVPEPRAALSDVDTLLPAVTAAGILLCVDDAQVLREADATLAVLTRLVAHGGLRVLLASRERLGQVAPAPLRLDGLSPDQVAALVAQLDPLMSPELGERLAARTGGNPMLLRLALGRACQPGSDRARIVDRLESDPQTGAHLIGSVLGELTAPARDLVDLLAVFRHPVDLHDEALVAQIQAWQPGFDPHRTVAELQRMQLVDHPTAAAPHPLIRDHLYTRLVGDLPRRQRLHAIAAGGYDRGDDPLEAAWHFSRCADPEQAADVLIGQTHTLIGRGQNLAAADLCGRLLRQVAPTADPDLVRRLQVARGDLLINTVRGDEADAAYRSALSRPMPAAVRASVVLRLAESLLERHQAAEALALCRDAAAGIGPREALLCARLDALQAWAWVQLSEYDEAVPLARRALELADPMVPELALPVVARAEWTLGVVLRLHNDPGAAAHLRRAATAAHSANLHHLAARTLLNLGGLRWDEGYMADALALFTRAEASARATADTTGLARAQFNTAAARTYLGELTEAVRTYREVRALRERLGDAQGVFNAQIGLANALCHLGELDEAVTILDELTGADWAEPLTRVHAFDSQTVVLLAAGLPEPAVAAARHGLDLAHRLTPARVPMLELHLATGLLVLDQPSLAERLAADPVPPAGFEAVLDLMFLRAALAHRGRDRAAMARLTADLATFAGARGMRVHSETPARLRAAIDRELPLVELPRLMWCPYGELKVLSGW